MRIKALSNAVCALSLIAVPIVEARQSEGPTPNQIMEEALPFVKCSRLAKVSGGAELAEKLMGQYPRELLTEFYYGFLVGSGYTEADNLIFRLHKHQREKSRPTLTDQQAAAGLLHTLCKDQVEQVKWHWIED